WQSGLFTASLILGVLAYAGALLFLILVSTTDASPEERIYQRLDRWYNIFLALGGACGVVAVGVPFLRNVAAMRFRRIYALAKLSFKEAIRRRVLYAFSGLLLVFLFASWFIPSKPEDQVRNYVTLVFAALTYLLPVPAILMAA